VITSLERTKWVDGNPDTAVIDKSEGIEHFSDGIRYGVEYMFPVNLGTKRAVRGFNF
jgi:CO dehydrogenase nickel-insertion accessory protein CooC1